MFVSPRARVRACCCPLPQRCRRLLLPRVVVVGLRVAVVVHVGSPRALLLLSLLLCCCCLLHLCIAVVVVASGCCARRGRALRHAPVCAPVGVDWCGAVAACCLRVSLMLRCAARARAQVLPALPTAAARRGPRHATACVAAAVDDYSAVVSCSFRGVVVALLCRCGLWFPRVVVEAARCRDCCCQWTSLAAAVVDVCCCFVSSGCLFRHVSVCAAVAVGCCGAAVACGWPVLLSWCG